MPDLYRSAIWYASHGWQVFPLRPHTKEPFKGLGVYHATTDNAQISAWWLRWPNANIGLHCGGSGLLGIDLDTYKDVFNGHGVIGQDDEETLTSITGSGGTHLLYVTTPGARYTNATGELPAGIDVRGWGGYLVLPPSIHPNGGRYAWMEGYGPQDRDPLLLPPALAAMLALAQRRQRKPGPPDSMAVRVAEKVVLALLNSRNLATYAEQIYDGTGRRWLFKDCPFNPPDDPHLQDRASYILIAADGHIAAGCQHARCRERLKSAGMSGWKFLLSLTPSEAFYE